MLKQIKKLVEKSDQFFLDYRQKSFEKGLEYKKKLKERNIDISEALDKTLVSLYVITDISEIFFLIFLGMVSVSLPMKVVFKVLSIYLLGDLGIKVIINLKERWEYLRFA